MIGELRNELLRVHALHALEYCERLFFLEEVENLHVSDAAVYAGRTLHTELATGEERVEVEVSSERLGVFGKVDAIRRKDGGLAVHEHKRGRHAEGEHGPEAWSSDRIQAGAYGLLMAERFPDKPIECRVRYHQTNTTVSFPLDEPLREQVRAIIARAQALRTQLERPPVTQQEAKCARCSLAPVCLPEEERNRVGPRPIPRLFPEDDPRQIVHVTQPGTRIGRAAEQLVITPRDGSPTRVPIATAAAVVLHGAVQVSAQALALCVDRDVGVHWFTGGGRYLGALGGAESRVHRRRRQFEALRDSATCLGLARRLVASKVEGQLRFLLRASRRSPETRAAISTSIRDIRGVVPSVRRAEKLSSLLGLEGAAAAAYFAALPLLLGPQVESSLRFDGRTRRPPKDRFNAVLSFLYGLVHREVEAALIGVGLDPAFGFYHQPRSSAGPLALDLMEEFRVPLGDMPLVASLNRGSWDPQADFELASDHVWLSASGRTKAIELFERRKHETWKHPVLGYSLSYVRMVELEARLLEKEWTGKPGLFATFRIR